ncbi:HalOD1 output domain-containing protein [Haloterrigena salinisoli]
MSGEIIDPEYLDRLFEENISAESSVVFHYNGCRVTV